MSFYVRVFSLEEDMPSLYAICDDLLEAGYEFATSPGKDEPEFNDPNWKKVVFQYSEDSKPIELERNSKDEDTEGLFKEEQQEFIDSLKELPYGKGQKRAIEVLKNMKQVNAFEVDEEMSDDGWEFLETMLDFICDATDGYVQVDEEGIYDKDGKLMVEME